MRSERLGEFEQAQRLESGLAGYMAKKYTEAYLQERRPVERLEAVDEMKNTFLQAVSHELRTPLTSIFGTALMLEQEDLGVPAEDARDLVSRMASYTDGELGWRTARAEGAPSRYSSQARKANRTGVQAGSGHAARFYVATAG
ncbi:MAG TPA: histidine kinase dimerization/phospho-acceptor domain-containing protein [Actinomycetota bacterium]|nr:histidine kinase dimerization/phospho-acceptor domain-containing protein [Actinomycetota bacterium]